MKQTEKKSSNQNTNKIQVKLEDAIIGIRKLSWVCALLAVIFGAFVFVRDYVEYVPYYTAEATLTVNTEKRSSSIGGVTTYAFYYNNATANQLSKTFPILLNSELLQDAVCEDLDVSAVPATLQSRIVTGSNMITVYSSAYDPQVAYDVLLSTLDNFPDVAKYALGNIQFEIITEPTVPIEPSNSWNYVGDVVKAMLLGAGIGCLLIILYVYSRNTIRNRDDIKTSLGCDTLGSIPHVSFKKYGKEIDQSILCTNEKVDKAFYEAVRIMRNVFKNSLKDGEKIIMGTSTAPSEGKTTVITNLALSLAEQDKKILLVDGDIRHPSVSPLLGLDPETMEFEIVTEKYKITFLENFGIYFMVFNKEGTKRLKYMNSAYVKNIFDSIRDDYDYILVDTPPCGLVSDALFFAQAADVAYYVILQDSVRLSKIQSGFNNLLATDIRVLGCVLNGSQATHSGHGYMYGYGGYGRYGRYGGYGRYGHYGHYGRYGGRFGRYGGFGRYGRYGSYGRYGHYGHYGHYGYKKKSSKKNSSQEDKI